MHIKLKKKKRLRILNPFTTERKGTIERTRTWPTAVPVSVKVRRTVGSLVKERHGFERAMRQS